MAMLVQQSPQGVYIRGTLMDQSFPAAEHGRAGLLLNRLALHKAHFWLPGRDYDRLGIGSVVFLALDERARVLWHDQLYLVAKHLHCARPMVRAAAGLKDDQARFLLGHKSRELLTCKLFAKLEFSRPLSTVDLENTLCQIDPNHHILHLAVLSSVWLSTPRFWHIAMPSGEGGNHPICVYTPG